MQSTTGFVYDWPFAGSIMNDNSSQEDSNARVEKYNAENNEAMKDRKATNLVTCPVCHNSRYVPPMVWNDGWKCSYCLGTGYMDAEQANKTRKKIEDNCTPKGK